jgi:hypothetical protein
MRAAEPIPEEEFDMLSDASFPDWEHVAGTAGPFEHGKAENWGRLEGRLVAIDYSAASELYDKTPTPRRALKHHPPSRRAGWGIALR